MGMTGMFFRWVIIIICMYFVIRESGIFTVACFLMLFTLNEMAYPKLKELSDKIKHLLHKRGKVVTKKETDKEEM